MRKAIFCTCLVWRSAFNVTEFMYFFFREIPFNETFSPDSTSHHQSTADTKFVNTGQSKTVHVNPGNQPPLVIVSLKQPGTPQMSKGLAQSQAYIRPNKNPNIQNYQQQPVPTAQGNQPVQVQNISQGQSYQTGQLRGQQFQRVVQSQQPLTQEQIPDIQESPEQLDEEIALNERQIEENTRKLLMYSQMAMVSQTQQLPQNVNIQNVQTTGVNQGGTLSQAQGFKILNYNVNKVQSPNQARGNTGIQSMGQGLTTDSGSLLGVDYVGSLHLPNSGNTVQQSNSNFRTILVNSPQTQSKVDVKFVDNTGAPNRTIQDAKPQVITLSNTRPKMCVQASQNQTYSQSSNFQRVTNQNIQTIRGSTPTSTNLSQTVPANQNWKMNSQNNNSLSGCTVIEGARVELKGGGKFEEGQIYVVKNKSGQEKKMIWTGGELVELKAKEITTGRSAEFHRSPDTPVSQLNIADIFSYFSMKTCFVCLLEF